MLKSDSNIFLLGAGASFDAKIPISSQMIDNVESLIKTNKDWKDYQDLYYCIKSGIINAAGILGNFSDNIVNIETLVNTMDELLKSYEHPLYPFIGSWIPRLTEVCGDKFINIRRLKSLIVKELCNTWTKCEYQEYSDYYKGFLRLQQEMNFPLSIFSLNYDMCLENTIGKEKVQRGFNKRHEWEWQIFDDENNIEEPILLYKLHGSMDWKKLKTGTVQESNNVSPEDTAIIFGTSYKLQYIDPFLYLVNMLRKKTLDKRTENIICVGYSFNDEHINGIISQAMKTNLTQRIISISPVKENEEELERICSRLSLDKEEKNRILAVNDSAKNWLDNVSCNVIESYTAKEDDIF